MFAIFFYPRKLRFLKISDREVSKKKKKVKQIGKETNLNKRYPEGTKEMNKRDKRFSVCYLKLRGFV